MNLRLAAATIVCALAFASTVRASLNIDSINSPVTITFDATVTDVNNGVYAGTGFNSSPADGQLDSDALKASITGSTPLAFGDSAGPADGPYSRGFNAGAVSTTGIWSFDRDNGAPDNRALGVKIAQDVSATFTIRVLNNTSNSVSAWNVAYDGFYYNDGTRATAVTFQFSTDDLSYSANVAALGFTSPAGGSSTWTSAPATASDIFATVADGSNLYLRWTFAPSGTGNQNYDQIAIDNIAVSAIPEPSAVLFGGLVCGVIGLGVGGRRLKNKMFARG